MASEPLTCKELDALRAEARAALDPCPHCDLVLEHRDDCTLGREDGLRWGELADQWKLYRDLAAALAQARRAAEAEERYRELAIAVRLDLLEVPLARRGTGTVPAGCHSHADAALQRHAREEATSPAGAPSEPLAGRAAPEGGNVPPATNGAT